VDIVDAFAKVDFTLERKSENSYKLYTSSPKKLATMPATIPEQQ
jgi:hypothetical protein